MPLKRLKKGLKKGRGLDVFLFPSLLLWSICVLPQVMKKWWGGGDKGEGRGRKGREGKGRVSPQNTASYWITNIIITFEFSTRYNLSYLHLSNHSFVEGKQIYKQALFVNNFSYQGTISGKKWRITNFLLENLFCSPNTTNWDKLIYTEWTS